MPSRSSRPVIAIAAPSAADAWPLTAAGVIGATGLLTVVVGGEVALVALALAIALLALWVAAS